MTAAVVNHLHFKEPPNPELFSTAESDLTPLMKEIEGFRAFLVVQVGDDHAILLIVGDTPDALNRVATEVGSPWMIANVVPLLAAPPERHIGPIVASSES
jgi:hypothetical protein